MITQADFLEIIAPKENDSGGAPVVQTAKVVNISESGSPVIQFDGDAEPSAKNYPVFTSYNPHVGERILIVNGVIIGGWVAQ